MSSATNNQSPVGPIAALPETRELFCAALRTSESVNQIFELLSVKTDWPSFHPDWAKELLEWVLEDPARWGTMGKVVLACQANLGIGKELSDIGQAEAEGGEPKLIQALLALAGRDGAPIKSLSRVIFPVLESWAKRAPDAPLFLRLLSVCKEQGLFDEADFHYLFEEICKKDAVAAFAIICDKMTPREFSSFSYWPFKCMRHLIQTGVDINPLALAEFDFWASAFVRELNHGNRMDPKWLEFCELVACGAVQLPPPKPLLKSWEHKPFDYKKSEMIDNYLRPFVQFVNDLHSLNDPEAIKTLIGTKWAEFAKWVKISPRAAGWMREHADLASAIAEIFCYHFSFEQTLADFLIREGGFNPQRDGLPAFFVAIERGNSSAQNWLLSFGIDVNAVNPKTGKTVLEAAFDGGGDVPKFIRAGARTSPATFERIMQKFQKRTGIFNSNEWNENITKPRIEALIEVGFDFRALPPRPLFPLIGTDFLKILIEAGIDITVKLGVREEHTLLYEHTLLHELIYKMASDAANKEKYLSLIEAILVHPQAGVLIEARTVSDLRNHPGFTPMDFAIQNKQVEVQWLLLQAGADPRSANLDPTLAALFLPAPPHTLTVRQFANLVGDDFIKKMNDTNKQRLEGENLVKALCHLTYSLKKLQSEDPQILELIQDFEQAIQFARMYEFLSGKRPSQLSKIAQRLILQHLRKLEPGKRALIPWGWIDQLGGHAMLAVFEREQSGFKLCVINTGNDRGYYFDQIFTGTKIIMSPVLEYRGITLEEMAESDFFAALIATKTELPLVSREQYTIHDLCQAILKRFEAKRVDVPIQDLSGFVQTQSSGTCPYRAPLAYARLVLGKEKYKGVKHQIQLTNAQEALELPVDLVQREVVRRASENLARQVRKLSLPLDQAKHSLTLIRTLKGAPLELAVSAPKPFSITFPPTYVKGGRQADYISRDMQPPPIPSSAKAKALDIKNDPPPFYAGNPVEFLTQLNTWAERYKADSEMAIVEGILSLPLPETGVASRENVFHDVWSALSAEQMTACLAELGKLQKNYGASRQKNSVLSFDHVLSFHHASAIFWRLSCLLNNVDSSQTPELQLSHYGISDAPLRALREHIHLLPYSPKREKALSNLIEFIVRSHPAYGNKSRTLFAFHELPASASGLAFPFPADVGETRLLSALVVPDEEWSTVDREIPSTDRYTKPDQHEYRQARLYASPVHPGFPAQFYPLRNFVMHGWFASVDRFDIKLQIVPIQPPLGSRVNLYIQNTHDQFLRSIFEEAKNVASPHSDQGGNSHPSFFRGGEYRRFFIDTQNKYLVQYEGYHQKYFDVVSEKNLSLTRLIQLYKQQPGFSLDPNEQAFFHLALFGQEKLSVELAEGGALIDPLFKLLEKEFEELTLRLTQNKKADLGEHGLKQETNFLKAYLSMALALFRLSDYCGDVHRKSQMQNRLRGWLNELPYETLHESKMRSLLAWTFLASRPDWPEFFAARQRVGKHDEDPSLRTQVEGDLQVSLPELSRVYRQPEVIQETLRQILKLQGDFQVEGTFPVFRTVVKRKAYCVDLLKGETWINGEKQKVEFPYHSQNFVQVLGSRRFKELVATQLEGGAISYLAVGEDYYFIERNGHLQIHRKVNSDWYTILEDFLAAVSPLYIPNTDPENLRIWASRENGVIVEDKRTGEQTFVLKNGLIKRPGSEAEWTCLKDDEVEGAQSLWHFWRGINFWRSGEKLEIEFPRHNDAEGKTIEFERKADRWVYKQRPSLFISPHQDEGKKHLVLEDAEGNRKALVPVKAITGSTYIYTCECIDMDADLAPKAPRESLIAAYEALGNKDYSKAWGWMKKSASHPAYSPEELRLLGWIFLQGEETNDFTPEARAIRLFAAWLVHENQRRHPNQIAPSDQLKPLQLYSEPKEWVSFWNGDKLWKDQKVFVLVKEDFFDCLEVSANPPTGLRWMREEHTVAPFERRDWIQRLHANEPDKRFIGLLGGIDQSGRQAEIQKAEIRSHQADFKKGEQASLDELLGNELRLRPSQLLTTKFRQFYMLATHHNLGPKKKLLHFLNDLTAHPDPEVQALRLILEAAALGTMPAGLGLKVQNLVDLQMDWNWQSGLNALLREYQNTIELPAPTGKSLITPSAPLELPPLPTEPAAKIQCPFTPLIFPHYLNVYFDHKPTPLEHAPYPELPSWMRSDPFYQRRHAEIVADWKVGCQKNDEKDAWTQKMGTDTKPLQDHLAAIQKQADALKKEWETLANQVDGDERKQIDAELDQIGLLRSPLETAEALALFTQRDIALYKKQLLYLSEENCFKLHQLLGNWLVQEVAAQRLTRALSDLTKADEFLSMNAYDPNECPQFLVFEYLTRWSLRKEQCENLKKQSDLKNRIIQMIPGFGKTEIFDPLLALMKADGYHLSLLVPIGSLVDSQAHHIAERALAISGKKAHLIQFGRGQNYFNLEYLRWLRASMHHAIIEREYLIATPETLQAMQNKYIEYREMVRSNRQTPDDDLCGEELKAILALIRKRGAMTLDEVDDIFDPSMELNFPGLDKERVDPDGCEMLTELLFIAATDPEIQKLGLHLCENDQCRLLPDTYEKIKDLLAKKLVAALEKNPRFAHLRLREYIPYLTTKNLPVPPSLKELFAHDCSAANRVVLLKRMFQAHLKRAWEESADEHYSRSVEKPEVEIAKPNLAASTPNEKAEFANRWITVIKSIHLYFVRGVDLEQTKKIVALFTARAVKERQEVDAASLQETESGRIFGAAVRNDLSTIDLTNPTLLKSIQSQINNRSPESLRLIIPYLLENTFAKLKIPTEQIFNNAQSFGSMAPIRQGHSGTLENLYIFPEGEIVLDPGATGRVNDRLLSVNQTVQTVELKTVRPFNLLSAVKPGPDHLMMIDIGAQFKGCTNSAAAAEINQYFQFDPNRQGVLFYHDKTNALNFLKKGQTVAKEIPDSDPETILSMTGFTMNQLFIYLDHRHRVGVNFKLPKNARSIATIGEKTCRRDLAQGSMRLRGLLNGQRIDYLFIKEIEEFVRTRTENKSAPLNMQDVVLFGEINSLLQEREENLQAALIKMADCASRFVLDACYREEDPEREQKIYNATRSLFVRDLSDRLYEQYAEPEQELPPDQFLLKIYKRLETTLLRVKPYVDPTTALATLKKISLEAEPHLAQLLSTTPHENSTVENIQEDESQDDQLALQLQNVLQTALSPSRLKIEREETVWDFSTPEKILEQLSAVPTLQTTFSGIPLLQPFANLFNPEIGLTINYTQTEVNKTNLFETLQKTPHEALLYRDPASGKTRLILLSNREASQFKAALCTNPGSNPAVFPFPITLFTADAKPLISGPTPIEQDPILLTQYLFLSARSHYLGRDPWKTALLEWLSTDRALKRDLYLNMIASDEALAAFQGSFLEKVLYHNESPAAIIESLFRALEMSEHRGKTRRTLETLHAIKKHLPALSPKKLNRYLELSDTFSSDLGAPLIRAAIPHLYQLDEEALDQINVVPICQTLDLTLVKELTDLAIRKFPLRLRANACLRFFPHNTFDEAHFFPRLMASLELAATLPEEALTGLWDSLNCYQVSIQNLLQFFHKLEAERSPHLSNYLKILRPYLKRTLENDDRYCSGSVFSASRPIDKEKFAQVKSLLFEHPTLAEMGMSYFIEPAIERTYFPGSGPNFSVVFDPSRPGPNAARILPFLSHCGIPAAEALAREIAARFQIDVSPPAPASSSK